MLPGVNGPAGATAINNSGQIVGFDPGGFLYTDGQVAHINDLVPPDSGFVSFSPRGINDAGQIVAEALDSDRVYHAVLVTPDAGNTPKGGVDPSVFRLLVPAPESSRVVEVAMPRPTNAVPEPTAADTIASIPADTGMRQATDAVFASSHQSQPTRQVGDWEADLLTEDWSLLDSV